MASVEAVRDDPTARRAFGFAAGAMLVAGAVVASAFGFNHGSDPAPSAAGEPVGALPSKGAPAAPIVAPPAPDDSNTPNAPGGPGAEQVTNPASADSAPQAAQSPRGEIGRAATIKPPAQANAPAPPPPPAAKVQTAPPPQAPAAAGPVQTLTEPVTNTVGGSSLSNAVAPVTNTVDNALQPALSLIGGLLGR